MNRGKVGTDALCKFKKTAFSGFSSPICGLHYSGSLKTATLRSRRKLWAILSILLCFERLIALELVEYDAEAGEYRLDDRAERFFDEMLGAAEVAQADWLVALLEEIRRSIGGYQKLADSAKGDVLLRRVCRLLRTSKSRIQRHLEEVKAAVDYDYRAGSDYEVKLLKLEWHLERAKSYGNAIADLNNLLRHDAFFQVHQEIDLLSLRRQVIHRCGQVGDALMTFTSASKIISTASSATTPAPES